MSMWAVAAIAAGISSLTYLGREMALRRQAARDSDPPEQPPWIPDPVATGLASAVVLGTALIALGEPSSIAEPLFTTVPNPLIGLVGAGLAVVVADWLVPAHPGFGGFVCGTGLAGSGASLAYHAPRSLDSSIRELGDSEGAHRLIEIAIAIGVLAMVGVIGVLLAAFVEDRRHLQAAASPAPQAPNLLPSQREFIDAALQRCHSPDLTGYKLIPVVGRWGDGKSVLLSTIERELRAKGVGVVRVNVWQSVSDPRFYETILRQVYGTPCFTKRFRWLRKPLPIALARVRRWRPHGLKLKLFGNEAEVDFSHHPPALPFAKELGRDLRVNQPECGPTVVIIVDELDRATPMAAQTTLSVLRRAFDQSGVAVLLAYVEDHVHFNTFDPTRGMIDDLRSTFLSLVHQRRQQEGAHTALPASAATPTSRPASHSASTAGDNTAETGSPQERVKADISRPIDEFQELVRIEGERELLDYYLTWPPAVQLAIQRRAAEKHLHGGSMQVEPVRPSDVLPLIKTSHGYREAVQAVGDLDEMLNESVEKSVETAIRVLDDGDVVGESHLPPPVRALLATVDAFFAPSVVRLAEKPIDGKALAALVVVLYRAAQVKVDG